MHRQYSLLNWIVGLLFPLAAMSISVRGRSNQWILRCGTSAKLIGRLICTKPPEISRLVAHTSSFLLNFLRPFQRQKNGSSLPHVSLSPAVFVLLRMRPVGRNNTEDWQVMQSLGEWYTCRDWSMIPVCGSGPDTCFAGWMCVTELPNSASNRIERHRSTRDRGATYPSTDLLNSKRSRAGFGE